MKHWAVFYELRNGSYIEPLGSFRIVRLDGRLNIDNMHEVASRVCKERKYDGYRIARGELRDDLFMLTAAVIPVKET